MQRISVMIALFVACLAMTVAATAGGPPAVNSTTHFIDEPFGGIGLNCASGNLALSNGSFSGVIHVLVKPDGSMLVSSHTRGTDALDDLPTDGIVDATTTFVFNSNTIALPAGSGVEHFTGTGRLTVTATGATIRFRVVFQLVVDRDGNPKLELQHFVCA